jgi:hypothetical protein
VVERLTRIPDSARAFTMSATDAIRRFRIGTSLLDQMISLGLPVRDKGGERHFDQFDLINSSMYLGVSPTSRTTRRFWPPALNPPAGVTATSYEVSYQPVCPVPGHDGPCGYELAVPGGGRVRQAAPETGPVHEARVALPARWPDLPPQARAALAVTDGLVFSWLPPALATDLDFIAASGLADCAGVCRLLAAEGQRSGLATRKSYGLAVAPPFSVPHYWAEFLVGEVWVPVDPVLIVAMTGWGVLDRAQWPPHRSPGAILARVSEERVPLAAHAPVPGAVAAGSAAVGPVVVGVAPVGPVVVGVAPVRPVAVGPAAVGPAAVGTDWTSARLSMPTRMAGAIRETDPDCSVEDVTAEHVTAEHVTAEHVSTAGEAGVARENSAAREGVERARLA